MDNSPFQSKVGAGNISMTTQQKRCNTCNELKPLTAFGIDRSLVTGRRGKCKACQRQRLIETGKLHVGLDRLKKWRHDHPDRVKEGQDRYYHEHTEKVHAKNNGWRKRHPEYKARKRQLARAKYAENPQIICDKTNDWNKNNRAKVNSWATPYLRLKRKTDPNYRLRTNLRRALNAHIRGKRVGSTIKLLGCSLEDFWIHLETFFELTMTRQNYGKVWEVHHVIPLAHFDLSKPAHQKRAFHFSNLRPLTIQQNRSQGAKITTNQYNLL